MDKQQQRLFRLTSQSNDGVFNTRFDEDVEISPGSSIALQSASFDRQSTRVSIGESNKGIKFGLLSAGSGVNQWTADMVEGDYSQLVDGEALLASTAKQMNVVIDMLEGTKQIEDNENYFYSIDKGSQWRAQLDSDGKSEIAVKTNNFCPISNRIYHLTDAFKTTTALAGTETIPVIQSTGLDDELDYMSRSAGGTGQEQYNECYVYGKLRMIKGTGCVRLRIAEIANATGSGICATVGLVTDLTKLTSGTIENNDIYWGLQVAGSDYQYRSKAGTASAWENVTDPNNEPNLLTPENVDLQEDGDNNNDVLEIIVSGKLDPAGAPGDSKQEIEMRIHQETNGETIIVEEDEFQQTPETDFYYFVSFHKPEVNFKADMMEVDLDPYLYTQNQEADLGRLQTSLMQTVVRAGWNDSQAIPMEDRAGSFSFPTVEIGEFFGYSPGEPFPIPAGSPSSRGFVQSAFYKLTSSRRAEFSATAKNYLVLFDELPLNSFDSYSRFDNNARNANSGGSRRNLLATVPVKEDQLLSSSVSQVAFEPNTLDYISLRNTSTYLTRTLTCRILTSTYQPIEVDGMASLTLLIRD